MSDTSAPIYAVAVKGSLGGGHGEGNIDILHIVPPGAYNQGPFGPMFKTRESAEAWARKHLKFCVWTVVQIEVLP